MANEVGYPDSVSRQEGAHTGDGSGTDLKHMGDPRKEWAGPGHAGRADNNKPLGPQSGTTPLMASTEPHGNQNDQTDYRKEWGRQ